MQDERINLIFDCDGTLIDSYGAIVDRVCRLFDSHNIICNSDKIREYSLKTSANECIKILCEQIGLNAEEMLKDVHELKEDRSLITLFPGVKEVLENSAFRCFVYTHRGTSCIEIFKDLEIFDYFEEIVDRTYGFKRKPDSEGVDYLVNKYGLNKDRSYYIGDRLLDIDCGINAGIKTIFFNSARLGLDSSGADHVIQNLNEINKLF